MLEHLTDTLVYTLDADPGPALADRLYGPAWRDSVVQREGSRWHARRLPPPLLAADLLAPLLVGAVAHDGRSTRDGRGAGWWLREEGSGSWQEVDVDALADALRAPIAEALRQAQARAAEVAQEVRRIERKAAPARFEDRSRALADARLSEALLAALHALIASGSSGRWGGVAGALRSRLVLQAEDLSRIVLEWLQEVAPLEGWDEGSRLSPAALWEAYEGDGGGLPRRTFLRALPALLGDLRKIRGDRFYVLSDLDAVEEGVRDR